MAKPINEKEVAKIMGLLKISRDEAIELIEYDRAVDASKAKDAPLKYDLSKEAEKEALKEAHKGTDKKSPNYTFTKRERKPNATKGAIIAELAKFLTDDAESACENVTIVKTEREISFNVGEKSYSLTLVEHRAPKK